MINDFLRGMTTKCETLREVADAIEDSHPLQALWLRNMAKSFDGRDPGAELFERRVAPDEETAWAMGYRRHLDEPQHLRDIDAECYGCGAKWQPFPQEEGGMVMAHEEGCSYWPDQSVPEGDGQRFDAEPWPELKKEEAEPPGVNPDDSVAGRCRECGETFVIREDDPNRVHTVDGRACGVIEEIPWSRY